MIIECTKCGEKFSLLSPPQPGKEYRCPNCGAVVTFLQTTDTQDTLGQDKAKKELDEKTKKRIGIGCAVVVAIAVIGMMIGVLSPGSDTEDTSSMLDLEASVIFDGAQFIITNNNSYNWTNIKFEVNSGLLTSGYIFRTSLMEAGNMYTVGAMQFAKTDGERLNPFTHKVQSISIWCDTPSGNGFWYGEWE